MQVGRYRGRGIQSSLQYGHSSNGGEQVAINLKLDTGEVVTTRLSFSGQAEPYSIERLKALGWDGSADFAGCDHSEVDVGITTEEYNGKEQFVVQILTNGFAFKTPMNAAQKQAFGARLAKLSTSCSQQKTQEQPKQQPPGDNEFGDSDEIPF